MSAGLGPRGGVQSRRNAFAHQLMVGGMELDRVAAKTQGVKRVQLRRILVGLAAEREHFGAPPTPAEFGQRR